MIYVWKNVLILAILIDSQVYFTRKSITITNNSRIFLKDTKLLLGIPIGLGEVVRWKIRRQ
jgi:hypothetical protein